MSKYIMRIHTWHYYVNGGVPRGQFEIQSKCNVTIPIPYKVVAFRRQRSSSLLYAVFAVASSLPGGIKATNESRQGR